MRPIILLASALGLAVALASGADAATKAKKPRPAAPRATAETLCRGANLFHCGPIYNAFDYLGTDPDPFIRLMIQRDMGPKYGGPE